MEMEEDRRPWDELEKLVLQSDPDAALEFLEGLPAGEAVRAVSRLDEPEQDRLLSTLPAGAAADLVEMLPDSEAADVLERLAPETAAAILRELPSDELADVIGSIEPQEAHDILSELEPAEARETRRLASYAADVAGGLMATEVLCYAGSTTVAEVVADLRSRADELEDRAVQYVYVSADERLVGVLRLRDLVLRSGGRLLTEIMIREPLSVRGDTPLDRLVDVFDTYAFLGLPVVDGDGRVLGVVHRAAVEEAAGERSDSDYLKTQGIVGGEEFRTMSVRSRSTRRFSWLSVNVLLNIASASVIALYQDTLASVIALAVFLPIISDMSGCSGNQAVAVSMRELSLGLVKPYEVVYVWLQELKVGVFLGAALGLLLAGVAWAWKGSPWLGLVVGGALALNTLVAVSIGGIVPLVLRRIGRDPALASGPILTTITDMCGFLLVLSFASALLPRLT